MGGFAFAFALACHAHGGAVIRVSWLLVGRGMEICVYEGGYMCGIGIWKKEKTTQEHNRNPHAHAHASPGVADSRS